MLSSDNILLILVSIITYINAQTVSCSGNCHCPTAPTGTTCILDCGGGQDRCKEQTLTCRANDPCIILCDAKATCSAGTTINAATATDVTVLCNGDDACKDNIDISCGTGHCELQCTGRFTTACQSFGSIDATNADSFDCIGDCPANIPAAFTASPTTSPTNMPSAHTANPTTAPSVAPSMPSLNPSTNPTSHPTIYPTHYPTSQPTEHPTSVPTSQPTVHPTHTTYNPTTSPTNRPNDSPTDNPTYFPTNNPSKSPSYKPTIRPSLSYTVLTTSTDSIDPTDSDDKPVNAALQTNGNTNTIDGVTVTVMIILSLGLCCVSMCLIRLLYLKNKRNEQLKAFGEDEMASKSNISSIISTWRAKSGSSNAAASPQSHLKSVKEEKENCDRDDWKSEVEICTPKGAQMSHNYVTQLMLQNAMNNGTHSNNSGHSARTEPLKNNNTQLQPTEIRRAMSQNYNNYAYNNMQYHPMTARYHFSPSMMPLTPPMAYQIQMATQPQPQSQSHTQSQHNTLANANAMSYTHTMSPHTHGMTMTPQQSPHSLYQSNGSQHTGNNQDNVTIPALPPPPPMETDDVETMVGAELSDISSSESIRTVEAYADV